MPFLLLSSLALASSSSTAYKLHADDTTSLKVKLEEAYILGRDGRDAAVQAGKTALPSSDSFDLDDDDSSETSVGRKLVKAQHLLDAAWHRGRVEVGLEAGEELSGTPVGPATHFGTDFTVAEGVYDGRAKYPGLFDGTSGRAETSHTLREDVSAEFAPKLRRAYFHGLVARSSDVMYYHGNQDIRPQSSVQAGTWTTTSHSGASSHSSDSSASDRTSTTRGHTSSAESTGSGSSTTSTTSDSSPSADDSSFRGPEYSETARKLTRDQRRLQHSYEAGVIDGVCDNIAVPDTCGGSGSGYTDTTSDAVVVPAVPTGRDCMSALGCSCYQKDGCPHVFQNLELASSGDVSAFVSDVTDALDSVERCVVIINVNDTFTTGSATTIAPTSGDEQAHCVYIKDSALPLLEFDLGDGSDCGVLEGSDVNGMLLFDASATQANDRLIVDRSVVREEVTLGADATEDESNSCLYSRDSDIGSFNLAGGEDCVLASRTTIRDTSSLGPRSDFFCGQPEYSENFATVIIGMQGGSADTAVVPAQSLLGDTTGIIFDVRSAEHMVADELTVVDTAADGPTECCEGAGCTPFTTTSSSDCVAAGIVAIEA